MILKKREVIIRSRRAQLDEINPAGIVGAVIGGGIGIFIAKQMSGGIVISIMAFAVCAIACYFLSAKILEG